MPAVTERELIETRYDWVCSQCGCLFFNRDWVITVPTLKEMIQHYKKMQRQAFDEHVCLASEKHMQPVEGRASSHIPALNSSAQSHFKICRLSGEEPG